MVLTFLLRFGANFDTSRSKRLNIEEINNNNGSDVGPKAISIRAYK